MKLFIIILLISSTVFAGRGYYYGGYRGYGGWGRGAGWAGFGIGLGIGALAAPLLYGAAQPCYLPATYYAPPPVMYYTPPPVVYWGAPQTPMQIYQLQQTIRQPQIIQLPPQVIIVTQYIQRVTK